ncbi:MAG TPA: DnaD domain protein [Syntrophomonadaceae bacterium]|nr:DnaD domain protein [Syntrophomonadaceae bacterium]HQE23422.1 DnaD domain protein [Syntrophomonadaceae bacterium]
MHNLSASVEILRWGQASIPAVLFCYGRELDLTIEDIGVYAAIFYTYEKSKPLFQSGVSVGQILQMCPLISKQKLARSINRLEKLSLLSLHGNGSFMDKRVGLEPLFSKLEELIIRDHHLLTKSETAVNEDIIAEYRLKIEQLELALEEEKNRNIPEMLTNSNGNFKKVADFISKKTGSLMSVKMANELKRWLDEMAMTPEFLLCMLEMCFERNIYNPRHISSIAKDLKEYSVNSVEGLENYFKKFVDDGTKSKLPRSEFDPDVIEFGKFTGIDMNAEARRNIYYKWRYDWGFSHAMIMKAGQIMCQRTKNGGLEYVDSVLYNWMTKEIRLPEDADRELKEHKNRYKSEKSTHKKVPESEEYEIYISPVRLEELKSNT